jgi:hypothetical protein
MEVTHMFRPFSLAIAAGMLFAIVSAGGVLAGAGNPAGTGQPSAECGEEGAEIGPSGFETGGFENAEEHYAGEGEASLTHAHSAHAVSQYDVACVHFTEHH